MASPGDKKGQRRGSCGHVMALFDLHEKCARCREKLIGEDNCVKDKPCKICDGFTPAQKEMLSTPIYKIRRDKKAGLLVSPKEVTVLQPVESMDSEPTFQSPSGQQAQSSVNPPATPPSSSQQPASFVTSDQLAAIADKWSEQFARMEALLSRGNVFSTPVSSVKVYLGGPTVKLVHQIQLDPQCQDKSVSSNISLDKFQTVNKVPFFKHESRRTVYCPVVSPVRSVLSHGHPQKKGVSPGNCLNKIKSVKSVFCVDPCVFAPIVPSVPSAVSEHNVGDRLQEFWQVWQTMGSNPRVVSILKRDYTLPFKQRPVLTRFPVVQSGYANPSKNMHLKEALVSLMRKLVVEKVVVKSSLAFYNRLFLVPKPNGKWRPILDLSRLNLFLSTGTFKMETPETIRLSLKTGEWVTSLDFSDAYFHIPIAPRSRKYLRFFLFHQTFQFTALPFGLATAPLEFTKVVKEVKLMAQARGIRIHQYLDDWLLRAPSPEICLQHTQTLLALCRQLGWVVNMTKSELVPKQVFNFVGYRFDLITGRVLPTQDW